ncbi:MAG: phosphosulfolactate synthase [Balneolaceae bacterium]|nr:phosphosulfolactate synthase [Balneolaceae bacterium]
MSHPISNLPKRTEKPRNKGITLALDKGFSVRQAEDFCEATSNYTDIVKLGWGTSLVTQNLKQKLEVYNSYNIPVYFGGTLFEAYVLRDELDKYVQLLQDYDIQYLEVSNGTIWLSDKRKNEIIKNLSKDFTVLSEVGSKNPDDIIPPYKWVKMIESELEAGAWKVICEARESGTVGVFRPNGEIRSGLIDEIADQISIEHLLFEAPNKDQQVWFIRKFGSNVNLGNIQPAEVISVETLRLGLRSDTLFDFYSIDDNEIRDLYSENKSDLSQESSS